MDKTNKRILAAALAAILALSGLALTACGSRGGGSEGQDGGNDITIAIPNDPTNEARALLLLEANGYIRLKEGAGVTATVHDVEDPNGIRFEEIEAAQIANTLPDVDLGIINSNYAIDAGLDPLSDSLLIEDSAADYVNIIAVREGNENSDATRALVAALRSRQVKDFIAGKYKGAVVSAVDEPTDGFDASVNYEALAGTRITVAASPTPHAEILGVAADILAEKNIDLEILEFTDYVQPNQVVESGEVYANYFQHEPYLDDFNAENGTHLVSAGAVHNEPMGLYAGRLDSLEGLKKLD